MTRLQDLIREVNNLNDENIFKKTMLFRLADVEKEQKKLFSLYGVVHPLPIDYEKEFKKMNQLGQSQINTNSQLKILRVFANKLGLYDAADYIKID
jgi:hypothetical protein